MLWLNQKGKIKEYYIKMKRREGQRKVRCSKIEDVYFSSGKDSNVSKSYRAYLYRSAKRKEEKKNRRKKKRGRERDRSEKRKGKEGRREWERERESAGVTSSGGWQLRELFQFISSPEASFSTPFSSRTFLFFLPFTSLSLYIRLLPRSYDDIY